MALWDTCPKCGKKLVLQPHTCDEDEIEKLTEEAIRKKKKGRRYSGKYKGRGKYKEKDY